MGCELLFEIGTEEIPAAFLPGALEALKTKLEAQLNKLGIPCESIGTLGTPRRLVAFADGLPEARPRTRKTVTGPPKRVAYDDAGELTRAGQGFARSQKVATESLFVETTKLGEDLCSVKEEDYEAVAPLLARILSEIERALPYSEWVRWGELGRALSLGRMWISVYSGGCK